MSERDERPFEAMREVARIVDNLPNDEKRQVMTFLMTRFDYAMDEMRVRVVRTSYVPVRKSSKKHW